MASQAAAISHFVFDIFWYSYSCRYYQNRCYCVTNLYSERWITVGSPLGRWSHNTDRVLGKDSILGRSSGFLDQSNNRHVSEYSVLVENCHNRLDDCEKPFETLDIMSRVLRFMLDTFATLGKSEIVLDKISSV